MLLRNYHMLRQEAGEAVVDGGSSTGEAVVNENQSVDSGNHGGQESGAQGQDNVEAFSVDSLPKEAQDLIRSLRAENAKTRTDKNNVSTRLENIESGLKKMFGGEDQESSTEEQIGQLSQAHESLSYENAVMGLAYENGIPMENYEYFNFLMDKAVNSLEEGQELTEEGLLEVIQKSKGGAQGGMGNTNTSVDDSGHSDPGVQQGMTLDRFASMSLVEKSELYRKSPNVYTQFMKQAREKKLL